MSVQDSQLDHTHDPKARSWIESAQDDGTDFPIQNLPFGCFRHPDTGAPGIAVAIGDFVVDLGALAHSGALAENGMSAPGAYLRDVLVGASLNDLMALPSEVRRSLRHRLFAVLSEETDETTREAVRSCLFPMDAVELIVPAEVGDFTDFYASINHATRVGQLFRPDNPLLPNYRWIPIGYHGRASSIVPSGTAVKRPAGQLRPAGDDLPPRVGPSERLDYELEIGVYIAGENEMGSTVALEAAEDRIFGLCLVNDWSARDIQGWEYQPLGPFLGKSFATSVSPWVVTREALAPFRSAPPARAEGDPDPLPYLTSDSDRTRGGFDIKLAVELSTEKMRGEGDDAEVLAEGSAMDLYWTFAQMVTHHASNGCNLRPGDLIASGTVSGPERNQSGCLLELTTGGREPLTLANGETRAFLEDGDEVTLRGRCEREGFRSIGFGSCTGRVTPS